MMNFYNPKETGIIHSKSGKFKLEIHHYNQLEDINRYNFTKGIVKDSEYKTIDTIYRNGFCWGEISRGAYGSSSFLVN
jgi:hypothetical protein